VEKQAWLKATWLSIMLVEAPHQIY